MVTWTKMMRAVMSERFMTARKAKRVELINLLKIRKKIAAKEMKLFAPRKYEGRPNYSASCWGRMLTNDRVKDPTDRKGGKLCRRRFRVPYPIFEKLVTTTRNAK
jgi:hypothetical protein